MSRNGQESVEKCASVLLFASGLCRDGRLLQGLEEGLRRLCPGEGDFAVDDEEGDAVDTERSALGFLGPDRRQAVLGVQFGFRTARIESRLGDQVDERLPVAEVT